MASTPNVYVAFLRGINVNGHRVIRMAKLRASLEGEGNFSSVKTWLQSGNVLVRTELNDPDQVSAKIRAAIEKDFGLDDVPVMIRAANQIKDIVSSNPFAAQHYETKRIFVAFLNELPCPNLQKEMSQIDYGNEEYVMSNDGDLKAIYFYVPDFAKYKLDTTLFEKKLKIVATSRNWRTTNKLVEMAKEMEADAYVKLSKKKTTAITAQAKASQTKREKVPQPLVGERRSKRKRN